MVHAGPAGAGAGHADAGARQAQVGNWQLLLGPWLEALGSMSCRRVCLCSPRSHPHSVALDPIAQEPAIDSYLTHQLLMVRRASGTEYYLIEQRSPQGRESHGLRLCWSPASPMCRTRLGRQLIPSTSNIDGMYPSSSSLAVPPPRAETSGGGQSTEPYPPHLGTVYVDDSS